MAGTILLMVYFAYVSMFAWAIQPQTAQAFSGIITYQGKLANSSGVAVSDGTYSIKFTMYNAASGGSCKYTASGTCGSPTALSVTVTNGLFSVNLGGSGTNSIDPTIFQTGDLYLGVTIASDSEMTPRKQLTNVGFAYNALYLSGLATSTSGGTGSYIPAADSNGNFVYTGTPQSTAVSGGVLYINPSSATSDYTLLGLAVGGSQKFRVDEDGDTTIAGTLTTTGNITPSANNTYALGSATAAWSNIFSSGTLYLGTALLSSTNNTADLGGYGNAFNDVFASGTAYLGGLSLGGGFTVGGNVTPSTNNTYALGSATSSWSDIFSSGTLYLGTALLSSTQNTTDLGGFGNAFNDVFSSGTAYLQNLRVNNAITLGSNGLTDLVTVTASIFQVNSPTITLGNTSDDQINLTGRLATGIIPQTHNTYDLGSTTLGWKDMHASGTIYLGAALLSAQNNTADLGSPTKSFNDLFSSGSLYVNTSILSSTNNNADLGSATNAFNDLFSSGSLYVNTSILSSTNNTADLGGYGNAINDIFSSGTAYFTAVETSGQIAPASLLVSGSVNLNGSSISLGDNPADQITVNGRILSDIKPVTNNTYDLGAGGFSWKDFYTSGSIYLGTALLSSTNNTADLGSATNAFNDLFSSGSLYVNTSILSSTNNNADLGGYGNAINDIFSSGTAYLAALNANGNITLGDATTDTITLNGRLASDAIPSSNNAYDLGSPTNSFNDFYASGTIVLGYVSASGLPLLNLNPGTPMIGFASTSVGSNYPWAVGNNVGAYFGGNVIVGDDSTDTLTFNSRLSGNIVPSTNNSSDLGAYGNAFNELFASGTIYTSNLRATDTILFATGTAHYSSSTLAGSAATVSLQGAFTQVPDDPLLAGMITNGSTLDRLQAIQVHGNYAYVIGDVGDFFRILDVSNPTDPKIIGGVTDATNLNEPIGLFISGKYAYVANKTDDSLRIIDISEPTTPVIVGGVKDATNLDGAHKVYVAGKYAYVASANDDSLRIIDVSDPTSPVIVGGVKDATNLNLISSVEVRGKYAYVTNYSNQSLRIINVSDPQNPFIVGGVQDVTNLAAVNDVYVTGRYAYVVAGTTTGRFSVVDISDPTAPTIVATVSSTTDLQAPNSVVVAGSYAYVAEFTDNAIRIIDVKNPARPKIVNGLKDNTNFAAATDVVVKGKYAYMTVQNSDTLAILDLFGTDMPTAHIGSVNGNNFNFLNDGYIGSDLGIGSALSVGAGGVWTQGSVNILGNLSFGSSSMFTSMPTNTANNYGFTFATLGTNIDQGDFLRFSTSSATGQMGDIMTWGYSLLSGSVATTTFTSFAANVAGATAFQFNTENTFTSSSASLDRTLLTVSNNGVPKFHIGAGGNVYAKNSFIANSTDFGIGDLAEYIDLTPGEHVASGDVIAPDPQNPGKFIKVTEPYSSSVAGIISNTAAFVMGANGDNRAALALAGLVYTHVSDENGPIEVGDMLVTASEHGYLMKYDPSQAAGVNAVIVATALEPHTQGLGTIKTLVRAAAFAGGSRLTVTENADGTLAAAGENDLFATSITSTRGTWSVDEDGNVRVKRIVAEEYVVEQNESAPTIGEGVLETGEYYKKIHTPAVQENSKIFVSFLTNLGGRSFHISEKIAGDSFTVMLSSDVSEFTYFDWWIVQQAGETQELETEQTPTMSNSEEAVEDVQPTETNEVPALIIDELVEQHQQTEEIIEASDESKTQSNSETAVDEEVQEEESALETEQAVGQIEPTSSEPSNSSEDQVETSQTEPPAEVE